MTDPGDQIETLRARIEESEEVSDDDRSALLDFSDELYLLQTKYSDHRHLKLLRHCTRMAEHVGGLADALENRDAAE
ncbi:MAG: response regulator RpfG family c-di-GMP phosphodiesterase, partial [Natronomonas sp.]